MTHSHMISERRRRPFLPIVLAVQSLCLLTSIGRAQQVAQAGAPPASAMAKRALGIDDYAKWNSVDASKISGDGKWVVYESRQTSVAQPKGMPHPRSMPTRIRSFRTPVPRSSPMTRDGWPSSSRSTAGGGRGGAAVVRAVAVQRLPQAGRRSLRRLHQDPPPQHRQRHHPERRRPSLARRPPKAVAAPPRQPCRAG